MLKVHVKNCVQKLKESERKRVNELEEFERKANAQLDRQLVLASSWNRALLSFRGKLKGTEWDPEDSHKIDFSDFLKLLDSNNVQFIEYSDYGQNLSGGGFFFARILNLTLFVFESCYIRFHG